MSQKEVVFEVEEFNNINATCFEVKMRPETEFEFLAGQFASFVVPSLEAGGRDVRRAYSIASSPEQRPIEFCVKLVAGGPGSTYLSRLRPGDKVRGFAPYGHFVFKSAADRKIMFIATGTGIAPFRSMIFSKAFERNPPPEMKLLLGIRDEDELLYDDEMKMKLGKDFAVCMSRSKNPPPAVFKGRVTDYLKTEGWLQSAKWSEWDFYLCGNGAMIHEMQAMLHARGVEKNRIFKEAYFQPSASTVVQEQL